MTKCIDELCTKELSRYMSDCEIKLLTRIIDYAKHQELKTLKEQDLKNEQTK